MEKVNEEPQSNVEVSSEGCAGYDALGDLLMYNWSTPRGLTARWCQLQARVAVGTVPARVQLSSVALTAACWRARVAEAAR